MVENIENLGGFDDSKINFSKNGEAITLLLLEKIMHFVDKEIKRLNHLDESSNQYSDNETHFYQLAAAHKNGYYEPFTFDETAMNNILKNNNASKELTEKTWAYYKQCNKGSNKAPDYAN